MRRTDRLFELLQIFRDGRLHRGEELAVALGVSKRTVYRDMETLVASGVPVEGERGVGYILREPIFLPPLTLTTAELEALNLGMRLASSVADDEIRQAAARLLLKIDAVLPERSPRSTGRWGFAVFSGIGKDDVKHLPALRLAIAKRFRSSITYRALDDTMSERIIRPLQVEFWGKVWTCTAWCELREDFRVFRVDRIITFKAGSETFPVEPDKSLATFLKRLDDWRDAS